MIINDAKQAARLMDVSAVRADVTAAEIEQVAAGCREYGFICAFAMPCFTEMLKGMLADYPDTLLGGVVGFPSGADFTKVKVAAAHELLRIGVDELDMVINIAYLKSGMYDKTRDDIRAVVDAGGGKPVKVILEVGHLTDDEIKRGSQLCVEAGAAFVKTGTGWAKPAEVRHIELIKSVVGNSAKVKAAGGIRDLATVQAMYDAGCERFGVALKSAKAIMEEINGLRNSL